MSDFRRKRKNTNGKWYFSTEKLFFPNKTCVESLKTGFLFKNGDFHRILSSLIEFLSSCNELHRDSFEFRRFTTIINDFHRCFNDSRQFPPFSIHFVRKSRYKCKQISQYCLFPSGQQNYTCHCNICPNDIDHCQTRKGGLCFSSVRSVYNSDTAVLELEYDYGCTPPERQGGLLQVLTISFHFSPWKMA